MSAADLDDAYDANTCLTCGWPTAASTACASCGTPPNAQVTAGAATGGAADADRRHDGVVRGKRATHDERDEQAPPRHPDLIDRAWSAPTRPDQWWVADFTYVWTLQGFCYTAFCVDVFSRRILGWRVTTSKTTALVTSVLEQALFTRRYAEFHFAATGLVHHSDAGSQYTSIAFTEALREAGIAGSIGSVGDALDNALMESAVGLYKSELIDQHSTFTGRAELERETASWVHWYNTARLHSSIEYRPPAEYEQRYHQAVTSARGREPRVSGSCRRYHPHYKGFIATTNRSANRTRNGTHTPADPRATSSRPLHTEPNRQYRVRSSHVPCRSGRPGSRRLHAGHRLANKRAPAKLIPG